MRLPRRMMQVWADYLDELRAGRTVLPDGYVEKLRKKATREVPADASRVSSPEVASDTEPA
jgi:hypothetical protein